MKKYEFIKNNETDKIWWVKVNQFTGNIFTFDKKKFYNFFTDFPSKLSEEELKIFSKENPILSAIMKPIYEKIVSEQTK